MKRIRIFISSPGDVHDERERARGVVHQLRRRYAGRFDLKAVLWEELPLQADMSFQQGIDFVLSEHGVDIAVFILWSRLGSPLGPLVAREDGEPYRSGTEREWDLMLRARQRCQNEGSTPRPAIVVYTRSDDVSFEERLRGKPDNEKAQEIDQKLLVRQFIEEEFHDAEAGTNVRAYHSFDQPTTFAKRLREHLTGLLDSVAGEGASDPVWDIAEQGPPFRGLDVFEFEHGPIFFGREDEIVTIRARLRDQARQGCGFMLICGPSGSGKSSLARAGVIPDICNFEIDESVHGWRRLAIKPTSLGGNLMQGLVDSLIASDVLPELGQWKADVAVPAGDDQFSSWLVRFQMRVMDALKNSGRASSSRSTSPLATVKWKSQASMRLVLLVDQLEELFSDNSVSDEARARFFEALETLARCGHVWILATVRSDFYQQCQSIPALVRMKEGSGQFDLLPPPPDGLARVITGPATLAGLTFERDGERVLSDAIFTEAAEHKELLPLVEHLLLELCDRRTEDGKLTFDEFRRVGGVEGALRKRCEQTYDRLSVSAQSSFDDVLSELVTLSGDGRENWVRRTVPKDQIATTTDRRELVDTMVAARLFTATTGLDGTSVVSVAHEALLRVWPRITEWINRNREFLRIRATVEQACGRWLSNGRDPSLLLPEGLPLEEGRRLRELGLRRVGADTSEYIEASIAAAELQRRKATSRRRAVLASLSGAIVVLTLLGIYAWSQSNLAQTALATVERQKGDVDFALSKEEKARAAADHGREEAEATLARSNYYLANARWKENRKAEARELLHRVPSKYRNFEWHLDRRQYREDGIPLYGHRRSVLCVAFSLDGSRLASGAGDRTIKLWNVATGEEFCTLEGHQSSVNCVAFSPNGSQLASSSWAEIRIWDVSSGKEVRTQTGHQLDVTSVAFSPDGLRLASGSSDSTIKLWDAATGEQVCTLTGHRKGVNCVAFSPDGSSLASGSDDDTIKLWSATTGEEIRTLTIPDNVKSIAFSPDGSRLASGGPNVGRVWNTATGEQIRTLTGHDPLENMDCIAFSPDGSLLASGSTDAIIKLWNVATGEEIRMLTGHKRAVTSVTFSPDGSRLASGSGDDTIMLWDVATEDKARTLIGHQGEVTNVTFSLDGSRLASGSQDNTIKMWDAVTGEEIRTFAGHRGPVTGVALSSDSSRLASCSWDKSIQLWDAAKGEEFSTLSGHDEFVCSVAFSLDGSVLASGSKDGTIKLWDVPNQKEIRTLTGHEGDVTSVTFRTDGSVLASGSEDETVKLWDAATGEEIRTLTGHKLYVTSVAFNPDGTRLATGSQDKTIKLWDAATGEEIRTLTGHKNLVSSVTFSPDGSRLTSSSWDNTIKMWDAATGEELRTLGGHKAFVNCVAFSPDCSRLASGSNDNSIKLWDSATADEVRMLTGHQDDVNSVAFSFDGSRFASSSDDKTVKIWDVTEDGEIRTLRGHRNAVKGIAFSPDGSRLASGSHREIKIWDTATGEEVRTLTGHQDDVYSVVYSTDGTRIFSKSFSGSLAQELVWDASTGQRLESETSTPPDSRHDLSPDGRWLLLPSGTTVLLVDLEYKHLPFEKGIHHFKARPKPFWHLEQSDLAVHREDWYSAIFHFAWSIRAAEAIGCSDDERFSTASKNLEKAYRQWRQSLNERAQSPSEPKLLLQRSVREVLDRVLEE